MAQIKVLSYTSEAQVETKYENMIVEATHSTDTITLKTSDRFDSQEIDLTHAQAEDLIATIKEMMKISKERKSNLGSDDWKYEGTRAYRNPQVQLEVGLKVFNDALKSKKGNK